MYLKGLLGSHTDSFSSLSTLFYINACVDLNGTHLHLQDLLNLGLDEPSPPPPSATHTSDPLSLLDASFGSAAPAPAPTPGAGPGQPGFPTATVFDKDGITITFAFSKAAGQPALTDIAATFTNNGPSQVTGFTLQVSRHSQSALR
jgi:hypothetical protein